MRSIAGRSTGRVAGMYYTYVLKSTKDNKLYIGWADDLKKRIDTHNKGGVVATRARIPLKLVYYEACWNKEDAISREKQLKTGFGRAYSSRRLSKYRASSSTGRAVPS